ncbi:MAG TPA: transglutaminaseTgpA domain-containing protein, partial [Gaiellales bacterium]
VLLALLAAGLAAIVARSRRTAVLGAVPWLAGVAAIVGHRAPSRAHPLAPFSTAVENVSDGVGRFASVLLPVDPLAEPAVHALLLAVVAVWLVALALTWLVARRPLPTAVLGVLPVAIASSEFPLPDPALRVVLLVALVLLVLAIGRRAGAAPLLAFALPVVLVAAIAGSVPGIARAGLVDWRAWGGSGGADRDAVATDVRYAWDQSYDGLHYQGDPLVVLRIRSARPSYWRVTVLDAFDGLRFAERVPAAATAAAGAEARVDPPPAGPRTRVQVEVGALDEPYLVGAGLPVSFDVPAATGGGTIDANGVVRVLRPPARNTSYTVSAVIADPTPAELRHPSGSGLRAPVDPVDGVPFDGTPSLPAFGVAGRAAAVASALAGRPAWQAAYAWATQRTAGAATPYDVAIRLERALQATHPYNGAATLRPGDQDALARWIVSGEAGYCQMFSASMTELLRLLGVPARIVEGFDTGVYDPGSKRYVVDDRDAHAWVEAWLPGTGFVPFDPTPGHTLPNQASLTRATTSPTKTRTTTTPRTATQPAGTAGAPPTAEAGAGVGRRAVIGIVLVVALVLALVLAIATLVRRRTPGGPREQAAAARARLQRRARRRGIVLADGTTNGQLAEALAGRDLVVGAWLDAADRAAYASLDEALAALPQLRSETRRLAGEIDSTERVTIPV